jgi:Kae1-associated kinase Bud32
MVNAKRKILGSGAEATVYLNAANSVEKERIPKNYRHPDIDSTLRKLRTRKESKVLSDLSQFGFVPKLMTSKTTPENSIEMEYVEGVQLKKLLDSNPSLARYIGKNLAQMHDKNIIHGDLTTSNMILSGKGKSEKLFFIDFGLSFNSRRIEDKAVDIHLFKQALESKHFKVFDKAYSEFLKGYNPIDKKEILERLEIVETRGRYKEKT